ncbi:MAG TPA: hypothetical protein VKH44_04485, partial [Pirellulaceae bacterium]|nr:hypothetical protein [Pirellulaceae bacterium]
MKIPLGLCALALSLALAGCGGSKPDADAPKIDPVPPSGTALKTPAKESPAPSLPAAEPKKTQPKETKVQGPAEPPKRANEQLRALAARLLEKNLQGAWRLNTAAALELEKLGDQAEADLVALLGDVKPEVRRGAAYYLLAKFNADDEKQVSGYVSLLDDSEPLLRGL